MTGGAVGRITFLIVKQMDDDGPIGGKFIPKRRRVFETGVDKLQVGGFVCKLASGLVGERGGI